MFTKLIDLPYEYDALEPYIDSNTMEIHHSKHHNAYVTNLNNALEPFAELHGKSLDELLSKSLSSVPESIRTAVRNHGGGVWNHNLYWRTMSPQGGGGPLGEVSKEIIKKFGSFQEFKDKLTKTAVTQFGSGWGWLVLAKSGGLEVLSTSNQDTPLSDGHFPLLNVDVWEHAYYLKYQNKRPDYVSEWWNLIDWKIVEELYRSAS